MTDWPEWRIRYAIRAAKSVYDEPSFVLWADGWLSGSDCSADAALVEFRKVAAERSVRVAQEEAGIGTKVRVWAAEAALSALAAAGEMAAAKEGWRGRSNLPTDKAVKRAELVVIRASRHAAEDARRASRSQCASGECVTDQDIISLYREIEAAYGGCIPERDLPGVIDDVADLLGVPSDRVRDALVSDWSSMG